MNATLKGFIRKELRQTLRDRRIRMVLFVAPIFQMTIFGIALSNEVRNVRLAARFAPSDTVAARLYDRCLASGWFLPAPLTRDPFETVRSGGADAVLVTPPGGLTRALGRGEAKLQLLVNAQNVLRAQAIEAYVTAILDRVAGTSRAPALALDVRVLYNPMLETAIYMVPGVLCMLVCIVTILLTSMSLAREREVGTLETLIAAPVTKGEILLGKTIPFVLLGMIELPLILSVAVLLFGVPMRGPLALVLGGGFFFILTTVSLGTFISTLAKNQQQAMLGGFLFLFPAVLLSGLMFPIENMPGYLRWLTYFNPLTHFIALLRNILLKGGDLDFFLLHAGALAGLAVVAIAAAFRRFRATLG